MVDLHSHILPGVDDGAADEDVALEMCRMAARNGTREIVATPKTNLRYPLDPAEIERKIASLQARLGDEIYIHRGADVRLNWENVNTALADPFRFTINGRQYLLVEFGDDVLHRGVGKIIERYRDRGVVPIVSQPERHVSLARDVSRLSKWVARGCLVQLTAGSLTGVFGERTQLAAFRLMDFGLVHFVASDAHSVGARGPNLAEAYDFVVYRWGEQRARRLFLDNPWAVLWGESIEAPRGASRRRRSLFSRLNPFKPKKRGRRRR